MRINISFVLSYVLLLSGLICSGCGTTPVADRLKVPPVHQIKVGGSGTIVLGESSLPFYTTDQFLKKIEDLLAKRQYLSAKLFIEKYPDLALDILRSTDNTTAGADSRRFIARIYDQLVLFPQVANQGWYALLLDRSQNPLPYRAFDQQRKLLVELLQNGRFEDAGKVSLTPAGSGVLLKLDVLYLKAVSQLLTNPSQETTAIIQEALNLAQNYDAYQQANLLILQIESQRRHEDPSVWSETWKQAVQTGNIAKKGLTPIEDPFLWERLCKLKPSSVSWPVSILHSSGDLLLDQTRFSSNALVWEKIGLWHLRRNENESALLAFRTSQSLETSKLAEERLRLFQCKALTSMKQDAAAIDTLLQLTKSPTSSIAASAFAMLGLVELRRDNLQRGIGLLLNAIDQDKTSEWSDRADVLSDLGLAFLLAQEKNKGLQYLHEAQHYYKQKNQYNKLLQSFQNELAYLEHTEGERSQINLVQDQIEKLEISVLN